MFIEVPELQYGSDGPDSFSFSGITYERTVVIAISDIKRIYSHPYDFYDEHRNKEEIIATAIVITGLQGSATRLFTKLPFEQVKALICQKTGEPIRTIDRFEIMDMGE